MIKHALCIWAAAVTVLAAPAAHAAIKYVANNGTDSGTCGAAATPCRSVTQAITNATAGNTISIGPGTYGDLDGDGTLGNSPGEEVPAGSAMINVTKALTIQSRDGAGSTVLDAGGLADEVVEINAPGTVVFGKLNHGLTLRKGAIVGLIVHSSNVTVQSNVAESNTIDGFEVYPGVSGVVLKGNAAFLNGNNGFIDAGTQTLLTGNVARQNQEGFVLSGNQATVTKNVATNNSVLGINIQVVPPGTTNPVFTLNHNAVVGNPLQGLVVSMAGNFTQDVTVAVDHNDYYGNGDNVFASPPNCGLVVFINDVNATPHNLTVTSTKDFWGAAGGPGANPKDDVCQTVVAGTITANVVTPNAVQFVVLPPTIK